MADESMMRSWQTKRLLSRPRVCVFCGRPPCGKNREHIIPKWFIELTGDPHREITLGPFTSQSILSEEFEPFRRFSFGAFTFPSCSDCNERFSELEARAKSAVTKLLNSRPLSASDFDVIFDWFDKIRIGLWLGYHYFLDRNYWGLTPHFFVQGRIAKADRALLICKARERHAGITFVGVSTPAFAHVPSCFTLIANEWFIVNLSYHFLVSEAAGLPYPDSIEFGDAEKLYISLLPGKEKLAHPLLPLYYDLPAVAIGQAVVDQSLQPDMFKDLRGSAYAETLFLEYPRTRPLVDRDGSLSIYPSVESSAWVPPFSQDYDTLVTMTAIETLQIQNQLIERVSVSSNLRPDEKEYFETEFKNCIAANNMLLEFLADES